MKKIKLILTVFVLLFLISPFLAAQDFYLSSYFDLGIGDINWLNYDYEYVEFDNNAYHDSSIVLKSFEGRIIVSTYHIDFKLDTTLYKLKIIKEGNEISRTFYDTLSVDSINTEYFDSVYIYDDIGELGHYGYIYGWIFPDTLYESVVDSLDPIPTYPYPRLYNYYYTYSDSTIYVVDDTLFIHYRPITTNFNDSYYSVDYTLNIGDDVRSYSRYYNYLGTGFHESLTFTGGGWAGVDDKDDNGIVNKINLKQNYPNPFNPTTTIEYYISKQSKVTLKVYDVLGREIAELVNGDKAAGNYKTIFDAYELSSGIYFYQLKAGDFVETKKLSVLK